MYTWCMAHKIIKVGLSNDITKFPGKLDVCTSILKGPQVPLQSGICSACSWILTYDDYTGEEL